MDFYFNLYNISPKTTITSRRQKLRNHDKEGYTASLEKERKRKYLIKNRNRGLGDPSASVGVDSPNPDGGVAGEPPASVGEATQPPTGAPAVDRYVTHQKHQYQHLYQHHTTQSFCPQDREGRINGGRNYYLSKSFSTLLLIFSFCNITQLIITPYSNTNVFGSWGTNTTLLGAHHWHSVGIG